MRISDWSSDVCSSDLHPSGRDPRRAALFTGAAAHGGARRPHSHGRRRAVPLGEGRGAGDPLDPVPHARLLSLDRRYREPRSDPSRDYPGDAAYHHLGASGPRHRPRRGRHGEEEAGGLFLMTLQFFGSADRMDDNIDAYLEQHQHKSLLRFITCGSVDDGKSTLIGRLLYDSKMIFEDQLAALEADSLMRISYAVFCLKKKNKQTTYI